MKRLITCALLLLVAVVVFASLREQAARAEDGAVVTVPAAETLREQYLERQRAKAALMSEEQLQQALETTDTEIRELDAENKVMSAAEVLANVVANSEGTRAAHVAQRMLQVYETRAMPTDGDAPFYGAPTYSPQPVPQRSAPAF